MSISPEQRPAELHLAQAPAEAAHTAAKNGESKRGVNQLHDRVQSRENVFRRVLRGCPPAWVEPLMVKFKSIAVEVKARPRAYSPVKMAFFCTLHRNVGSARARVLQSGDCKAGYILFPTGE